MHPLLHTRPRAHRALCGVLAAAMSIGSAPVGAQQPLTPPPGAGGEASQLDASYALPAACFVLAARPAQVFHAPALVLLPTEVIHAAVMQASGIDPLTAEQLLVSASPPGEGQPGYSLHAKFSAPAKLALDKLPFQVVEQQVGGRTIYQSAAGDPMGPSFSFPDDRTIVMFDGFSATRLPADASSARGPLLTKFLDEYQGDDLLAMLDVEPLRPLIALGLAQEPVPAELADLVQIPNLVKTVKLRLNVSRPAVSELVITANNNADADRLVGLYDRAQANMSMQIAGDVQKLLVSDDAIEQATGRYMERLTKRWNQRLQLVREGNQLVVFRTDGSDNYQFAQAAAMGGVVAVLLPVVQAAREEARRFSSINNMKQIMLGLLNYESAKGLFPASSNFDSDGKPLLSWRVHILPFMEHVGLYRQFHLDEPWDSEHNKALISKMPELYLDPSSSFRPDEGQTHYLGARGEGRFFDGTPLVRRFQDIVDGSANTAAVVQVDDARAVVWTKPDDWELEDATPMMGLGHLHHGVFLTAFADGHVRPIQTTIDVALLKALLTVGAGDVVNEAAIP